MVDINKRKATKLKLAKNAKTKKHDSSSLLKVFKAPGVALGGYVGSSWRYVGLCWAILEQLGDKMRPESAKMSQDSAQERQDETR